MDAGERNLRNRRARVRRKRNAADVSVWRTATVWLLPRLLKPSQMTLAGPRWDCQGYAFVPGQFEAGVHACCADGNHRHEVLFVIHTASPMSNRI